MAVRRATRQFDGLAQFMDEYTSTLSRGGLFLPPGTVQGELAPQFKLDLVLPVVGRVGPLTAQVVHRAPDGGVGVQLPQLQVESGGALDRLIDFIDQVRSYLLAAGDLVEATQDAPSPAALAELEALRARVAQLEAGAPVVQGPPGAPASAGGRGFAVPDLSGVTPALQGALNDRSFRDAIVGFAVDRVTGLVTIRRPDGVVRYGFWQKGGPVGWAADPLQEQEVLGILLMRAGQLSQAQVAESLEVMKRSGSRQGEALIEMGLLTFPQVVMVLGKQVEYVLQRVLRERSGTWAFHPLDALPERFLPPSLRVPSLLYRGLITHARELPGEELAAALRPYLDRYVSVPQDVAAVLKEIKLTPDEKKFLAVMQSSTYRLRELYTISPMARHITAAVVWAFNDLGFLHYEDREDRERTIQRIERRVTRKRAQMEKATLFDVLEIHWICLPQEIDRAYKRLAAEFDEAGFKELPPRLLRDAQRVRARLDEAFETLHNDNARREYRKQVVEWFMIVQSAELLVKKGEMALMRRERREALTLFAKALELTPGRPEFREAMQRAMSMVEG